MRLSLPDLPMGGGGVPMRGGGRGRRRRGGGGGVSPGTGSLKDMIGWANFVSQNWDWNAAQIAIPRYQQEFEQLNEELATSQAGSPGEARIQKRMDALSDWLSDPSKMWLTPEDYMDSIHLVRGALARLSPTVQDVVVQGKGLTEPRLREYAQGKLQAKMEQAKIDAYSQAYSNVGFGINRPAGSTPASLSAGGREYPVGMADTALQQGGLSLPTPPPPASMLSGQQKPNIAARPPALPAMLPRPMSRPSKKARRQAAASVTPRPKKKPATFMRSAMRTNVGTSVSTVPEGEKAGRW